MRVDTQRAPARASISSAWRRAGVTGHRVLHRIGDGGGAGDGPALAHALDAQWIDRRAVLGLRDGDRREVVGAGDRVVHEAAREELARGVVDDLFHEAGADSLDGPALELSLDD